MRFVLRFFGTAALLAAGALAAPAPAQAWWHRGFYGPRVFIAPAPVVVAPAPVYVVPRPYGGPVWIRPHYNRFGYFVPGHWQ